ncbi:MAG: hypothetical protein AAB504_00300 [Patescibacteria group bacterium]
MNKHERYFFDIPVFRCEIDKWIFERENRKIKLAQNITGIGNKITEQDSLSFKRQYSLEFPSYYYGETVGMIRLYAINQQIRGELFFVKQRISKNLKSKNWVYNGKIFELWISSTYTNKIIFEKILKILQDENQKGLLKNRFINLEAFHNSGNYINYLNLVNFL